MSSSYFKSVGSKIRAARKEKGISLRKFCALYNLDISNMGGLELGKHDVRLSTLIVIAKALDKDVKDFL